ncbi:MAG: hypothetical protein VYA34_15535 [Myxococcota bacterium]|nr:hypothetical protein [Myxococcota bacterium]
MTDRGFDIAHPFSLTRYNRMVDTLFQIDEKGEEPKLGMLVGNTKTIWPHFIGWLGFDTNRLGLANPLEDFVEKSLETSCQNHLANYSILWTHRNKPLSIPAQKLAHVTGLAYLSTSQLNIHPTFGPWFALRAVVLLPGKIKGESFIAKNPCEPKHEIKAYELFKKALAEVNGSASYSETKRNWKKWLKIRDAFEVGKEHRYGDNQINYHYTGDRAVLERELRHKELYGSEQPNVFSTS